MDREADPYFALGGVGYQQSLGYQLTEYVSPGSLFQAGIFYDDSPGSFAPQQNFL